MNTASQDYYKQWLLKEPDADERLLTRNLSHLTDCVPEKTKVHLIGICGKGTATLAGLLIAQGFVVTGSDETFYPPMSTIVENLGITIYKNYSAENINDADLVIVGNVCTPHHVEVIAAKEKNILQISMSEALEYFFLNDKKNIIVTGTHGKTTLTGMIAWLLEHASLDPLYFIGGVIQGQSVSHRFSRGDYTVLEGDEYDTAYFDKGPKFLHYQPWCGIITSCEYDHVTMYPSFEEYQQAYRFFIDEINADGFLIVHESVYTLLKQSCDAFTGTLIIYGSSSTANYRIIDTDFSETQSSATISNNGTTDTFSIQLPGTYNLENALVAYIVGTLCCGCNPDTIKKYLSTFPGMERRQQVLFKNDDYLFLDDFAHHPTAVKVTLEGIRSQYPKRRIICLFEPRSNSSRKKLFEKPYSEAFDAADVICICAPELRWNDDPNDFVDINHIVDLLNQSGKKAYGSHKTDEVLAVVHEIIQPGDLIITMSNASFDGIQEKIVQLLSEK